MKVCAGQSIVKACTAHEGGESNCRMKVQGAPSEPPHRFWLPNQIGQAAQVAEVLWQAEKVFSNLPHGQLLLAGQMSEGF